MTYYDLGTYSRAITTTSPEAQLWFDRGLIWVCAYNHEEAVKCFKKALEHDPDCAMAHWGVSYGSGPNYNLPWELLDPNGQVNALAASYDAMQKALACAAKATPIEQALIRALPVRYPQRDPPHRGHVGLGQGLHPRHARPVREAPRRSRRPLRLRRGDHERDALADVEPRDRQAGRRRRHRGSDEGAGAGLRNGPPPRGTIPACCTSTFI